MLWKKNLEKLSQHYAASTCALNFGLNMFIWLGMSKQWCWKWDKLCETQVCETQLWVSLPLPPCRLLLQFPAKFKLHCFPSFSSSHTLSLSDLKTIQTAETQHRVSICSTNCTSKSTFFCSFLSVILWTV